MATDINEIQDVKNPKQKIKTGKICFVGCPAVGKTTLMKMLSQKMITKQYYPTQGFDLSSVVFDDYKLNVWDFGGQKAYLKHYLSQYIYGSDLIFIVTDSTPKNVLTTKELVEHAQSLIPDEVCRIVALANKQDLPGALDPKRIKNILQIPTIGICAIDPTHRDILIDAIGWVMNEIEKEKESN